MLSRLMGDQICLPGIATAHSHAFQRALRGYAQQNAEASSFWSWRGRMYELVNELTPERLYQICRFAYCELAMSGVTAVGEFHYLHHQPDGTPYDDRLELSHAVIQAATDVGIRIALLRVLYERGSATSAPDKAQRRFVDGDIEHCLHDVEGLRTTYADNDLVSVGMAIHSVRAVSRPWIQQASAYAKQHELPLHMHVSEQRREVEECVAEHSLRPVELLHEDQILDKRFVAVHATHLTHEESQYLLDADSVVCLCRTTERDLGDGHSYATRLVQGGARICTGIDSHAICDPFEEARAIELDERTRCEARTVAADGTSLLTALTQTGYQALGLDEVGETDKVTLRAADPSLVGAPEEYLDDAVVFAATTRAVDTVVVNGNVVVEGGLHPNYEEIRRGFLGVT